jgi:hypothetical protein
MTAQVPTEMMDPGARGSVSSSMPRASCRAGLGLSLEGLQPGLGHGLGGEGTAVGVDEVRLKEVLGEGVLRGENVRDVGVGARWH